jgi:hypothetical protein
MRLHRSISSPTRVARRKVVAINRARHNVMWGKRGDMAVRRRAPFNAQPPSSVLAAAEITALDTFYSRNHGAIPDIAPHQCV